MSENEHHTLILTDANTIIDYGSCGMEVLALVSEHVAPMVVPDVVPQEVRTLTKEQIKEAGIVVVETPLALLAPPPPCIEAAVDSRSRLYRDGERQWMDLRNER